MAACKKARRFCCYRLANQRGRKQQKHQKPMGLELEIMEKTGKGLVAGQGVNYSYSIGGPKRACREALQVEEVKWVRARARPCVRVCVLVWGGDNTARLGFHLACMWNHEVERSSCADSCMVRESQPITKSRETNIGSKPRQTIGCRNTADNGELAGTASDSYERKGGRSTI